MVKKEIARAASEKGEGKEKEEAENEFQQAG